MSIDGSERQCIFFGLAVQEGEQLAAENCGKEQGGSKSGPAPERILHRQCGRGCGQTGKHSFAQTDGRALVELRCCEGLPKGILRSECGSTLRTGLQVALKISRADSV